VPLLLLSKLIGHALFIALVRLFCREVDSGGIAVYTPRYVSVYGDYALIRVWKSWRQITVYHALTQSQRQVFLSGSITFGETI
jgi:hypothetical protein